MESKSSFNILIGCTGSVATIKVPILAEKFISLGHRVNIIPTQNAFHFLKAEGTVNGRTYSLSKEKCIHFKNLERLKSPFLTENTLDEFLCKECETKRLYPEFEFVTDLDEWEQWNKRGDPVKHIELRNWADLLLISPLDANTLAKIAQGLCDNLLTCVVRAWDINKPVLFCPAMNTQMYKHPFTSQHISILKGLGYEEIQSTSKTLMCGDTGIGAMAEVDIIVDTVKETLKKLAT